MDDTQHKALRAPFPATAIGKLPRATCRGCRDAQGRVCERHIKSKCGDCDNYITTAHMHLDYVGHADLTDRLLDVDPEWVWEPMAIGTDGLPLLDKNGGMWIRLTIAGVTRIGYGHADGKSGGDAVKEVIGDCLRNAAMRFGVALDLWKKEPAHDEDRPLTRQVDRAAGNDNAPASAPDAARQQLLHVCQAMQLDPAVVAQAYHATWKVRLQDEQSAERIEGFTGRVRNGEVEFESSPA